MVHQAAHPPQRAELICRPCAGRLRHEAEVDVDFAEPSAQAARERQGGYCER